VLAAPAALAYGVVDQILGPRFGGAGSSAA